MILFVSNNCSQFPCILKFLLSRILTVSFLTFKVVECKKSGLFNCNLEILFVKLTERKFCLNRGLWCKFAVPKLATKGAVYTGQIWTSTLTTCSSRLRYTRKTTFLGMEIPRCCVFSLYHDPTGGIDEHKAITKLILYLILTYHSIVILIKYSS